MRIIGFGHSVRRQPGGPHEYERWHPDLPAVGADTFRAVREALAADGRKHTDDYWATTLDKFLGRYTRVAKKLKMRPNPDDPANTAKLAALLMILADDIWFKFYLAVADGRPATAAEIGPGAVDTPDGPALPNGWGGYDQWEYTLRLTAWKMLGISADSWESPGGRPPARLRDLLDGSPTTRPAIRLRDLLGRGN